jgi:hypothetical protein
MARHALPTWWYGFRLDMNRYTVHKIGEHRIG